MSGMGRSRVLAVRAPEPVMSAIAPIGLAASQGTALVVGCVGFSGRLGPRTLADIVSDGPRHDELSPGRPGVARIAAGPIDGDRVTEFVDRLAASWPAVVVAVGNESWPGPTVPVHVLYRGLLETWEQGASVWQPIGVGARPPGPGPLLPTISPRHVRSMLMGRLPRATEWLAVWRQVWRMSWA